MGERGEDAQRSGRKDIVRMLDDAELRDIRAREDREGRMYSDRDMLLDHVDFLVARVRDLEAALRKHGEHDGLCTAWVELDDVTGMVHPIGDCSCGLAAVLAGETAGEPENPYREFYEAHMAFAVARGYSVSEPEAFAAALARLDAAYAVVKGETAAEPAIARAALASSGEPAQKDTR